MPHAALLVVQASSQSARRSKAEGFNAARGFVGGASPKIFLLYIGIHVVSMPHAALLVVQARTSPGRRCNAPVSMPHAALLVVQVHVHSAIATMTWFQCRTRLCWWCKIRSSWSSCKIDSVSMPHAALLVVQASRASRRSSRSCFNAARGFVGGARPLCHTRWRQRVGFNAARGFVGGASQI